MATLEILATELASDPLGRGYSGMTDQQAADDINDEGTGRTHSVDRVETSAIFVAIVPSEYQSTSATDKSLLYTLFTAHSSTGVMLGGNAQMVLLNIFEAGTVTRANLIALATVAISRGVELGISVIHAGDVAGARAL